MIKRIPVTEGKPTIKERLSQFRGKASLHAIYITLIVSAIFFTFAYVQGKALFYEYVDVIEEVTALEPVHPAKAQDKMSEAEVLEKFLTKNNSPLASYAEEITEIPRFVESVCITKKETSFCNAGVGSSKDNCGAIKNSTTGNFKVYRDKLEAVQDIGILLQKPLYKQRTIPEMNGIYCQDSNQPGKKCVNWSETIMSCVDELNGELIINT